MLLIVYLIVRKKCTASYYISQEVHRKYRNRKLMGLLFLLATVGTFVGFLAGGVADQTPVVMFIPLALLITSLVFFARSAHGLTIAKHREGTEFWLKGCKPEFFDELRRQFAAA